MNLPLRTSTSRTLGEVATRRTMVGSWSNCIGKRVSLALFGIGTSISTFHGVSDETELLCGVTCGVTPGGSVADNTAGQSGALKYSDGTGVLSCRMTGRHSSPVTTAPTHGSRC